MNNQPQKNKTSQPYSPHKAETNMHGGQLTIQYSRTLHWDTGDKKIEALGGNRGLKEMAGDEHFIRHFFKPRAVNY